MAVKDLSWNAVATRIPGFGGSEHGSKNARIGE
jgi:hypothetical protein